MANTKSFAKSRSSANGKPKTKRKDQTEPGSNRTDDTGVGPISNQKQPTHTKKQPEPARPHVTVTPKGDESVESLLRRFNREVMRAGILRRMKELEFYEKPSAKRKREREERRKMRKQGYRGFEEFEWMEE